MPKQITRNPSLQWYCVHTIPRGPQCECGRLTLEGRAEMDSQSLLQLLVSLSLTSNVSMCLWEGHMHPDFWHNWITAQSFNLNVLDYICKDLVSK